MIRITKKEKIMNIKKEINSKLERKGRSRTKNLTIMMVMTYGGIDVSQ